MTEKQSRRKFLQTATITAASMAGMDICTGQNQIPAVKEPTQLGTPADKKQLKLGLASYTLRKFGLDEVVSMTKRVGIKYICLKDVHLRMESSPDEIKKAAAKIKDAGLEFYGCGVIYMNSESEVNRAFEYAKCAGVATIVGAPKPELLKMVDEKVREYNIRIAVHNHGPGDKIYPTSAVAYEKIKGLDERIGLCMDVGHEQRAGITPSESAAKFADRLLDVHIKDVSEASEQGHTVEMGRGVIDISGFIRTLLKTGYAGIVSFEYEKDEKDPLAGLAESVGYVKGVLAAI